MKVLLTGATGLLGNAFAQAAMRRGFQLTALGFGQRPALPAPHENLQLDLREPHALERVILDHFPDVIVNAAAYSHGGTLAGVSAEEGHLLNVALPERLAQFAHHISARLYHLSTDVVFDGTAAPYRTTDMPNPQTDYARLKAQSEKQVLTYGGYESTVLRISVLNGNSPGGNRSIHEQLFHRWMAGEQTRLYTDEIRQPTSAGNVADLIVELCERPQLHGLFHWAGSQALSFYEIGRRIAAHFGLPESLALAAEQPSPPAHRRGDLSLVLDPLVGKVKTRPLDFEEQLEGLVVPPACAQWFAQHSKKPVQKRRFVKGVDF